MVEAGEIDAEDGWGARMKTRRQKQKTHLRYDTYTTTVDKEKTHCLVTFDVVESKAMSTVRCCFHWTRHDGWWY